ncbi:bacitracin ABC transporter permease [Bacillus manliponensis]|uniref:Bacitracin ABC transporter permease n=1 Tax=Bacillus manliponensis TaxID=574376 RepID=A0A073JY14_9BACI|nr:undecaprenyl-diphosphatase [Bacillus manliponensis]KEK19889.1 bacitracin ABC transporter permease [Bacillus manliponensis]
MSLFQYNIDAFRAINDLGKQYPSLEPMIIFVAEYTVYFLALLMLFYWFTGSKQNRMMMIHSMFAFILAEVIGKTVGLFHSNHQPFAVLSDVNQLVQHEIDNSFPSDHTILFFSICTSIWLVRKKEGWIWMILACCVATSRILVGVHYPLDVAVGALIGILSAVFVYKFAPKMSFIKQLLSLYEKIESNVLPAKKQMKN